MSHTPKFDAKIKVILDATHPGERECPISLERWTLTQDDIERCRVWKVPPSDLAPFTRMRWLATYSVGVDVWWKPHALTGKPMLTYALPDSPVSVVTDQEFHLGDFGIQHGLNYDPAKSFVEHLEQLVRTVPMPALYSVASENCVGAGYDHGLNSYMVFGTFTPRNSWYLFRCNDVERCMDGVFMDQCQDCFSCAMCTSCHGCRYAFASAQCLNSAFLYSCLDAEQCFGATHLGHKKYVFMNRQLTKEAYEEKMRSIDLSCASQVAYWQKEFRKLMEQDGIWPDMLGNEIQESTGDYLYNVLRVTDGYNVRNSTDLRGAWFCFDTERCESVTVGKRAQECYMTATPIRCNDMKFCCVNVECQGLEYCTDCYNSELCFGCRGLNRKKFHIFNKPYSEEDYWPLVDKIKCDMLDRGEYGQLYPMRLLASPPQASFGSVIAPFTAEELARLGVPPFDPASGMRLAPYGQGSDGKDPTTAPDCIGDVGAEWSQGALLDKDSGRRFNVSENELAYRKEHGYPFPRQHHRARLLELVRQMNGPRRLPATCAVCSKSTTVGENSTYQNRRVLCRKCCFEELSQEKFLKQG